MVDYFEIGHIDNTHGLKGELKVRSYSSTNKRFEELDSILVGDSYEKYDIEKVRYQNDIVLLKLKNVDIIEDAEKLKGKSIYIKREDAKSLDDGEYFIADLIGCEVYEEDTLLGTLDDIFTAGAADVYVVKCKGKDDLLLPALKSVILETDVANKKIRVKIPEGLK
ncbi:MAG: 16S rRNA processing protein RimM [Clostridia bacterium]|nr:16S rRNA processing protein RimM [Clostridia bacterium]